MSLTTRRVSRALAVTTLAAATTFAGAGIASATATEKSVDGNEVSVTFALEDGQVLDTCGAVLSPTASAPQLAERFTGDINLEEVLKTLNDPNLTVLKTGGPVASPVALLSLLTTEMTVSANNVPDNVYSLVTVCLNPGGKVAVDVDPGLLVGNPVNAVLGSLQSGSSGENLGALSTVITGSLGGGK